MDEIYEVKIIDNDSFGNGIARVNSVVVFIPNAILDEIVKIKIVDKKKKFFIGEIIEIIKESSFRVKPSCKYYNECGGCCFLHVNYEKESEIKESYIRKLFPDVKINSIVNGLEYDYRNKVVFHVVDNKLGFYESDSNFLINVDDCLLISDSIRKIYKSFNKLSLVGMKEVMIRTNLNNDIMISINGDISNNDLLEIVKFDSLHSLYQNDKLIYGDPYLVECINDLKYTIYPNAFFQVNTFMMIKLYDKILEYALKGDKLLDLYCGTGTIGMYLKDNFKSILGIEINKDSIKNAKLNKKINGINNIDFICGDAGNISSYFDVVVVDPPRNGLSKKVIKKLIDIGSNKIIYTSCNPNTLKRDVLFLSDKYELKEISLFNMFPKTKHVECVCNLELKNK